MSIRTSKTWLIIEPVVTDMAYELVGIELINSSRKLLRVYIDSEKGITVEDCARVSNQLSTILDVEDPISGSYILEVSSPGLNRPLFKLEHYQRFIGERAKIKLAIAFEGRRNFSGTLIGVEDDMVVIRVDNEEYLLPLEQIERANIIADLPTRRPKHKKN